jgi:hypothetical protein
VYAFGILSWEILHGQKAFAGVSVSDLVKLINDEQKRPKIDESLPENIKMMIRSCWQQEPSKRPDFKFIIEALSENAGTLTI